MTNELPEFYLDAPDVRGRGKFIPVLSGRGHLAVFKCSRASKDEPRAEFLTDDSLVHYERIWQRRDRLVADGILVDMEDYLELVRDHTFRTPSEAASVLRGHPLNGWKVWRSVDDNRQLSEVVRGYAA